MIFKSSTVAIFISGVLSTSLALAAHPQNASDLVVESSAFNADNLQKSARYQILLNQPSALDSSYLKLGKQRSSVIVNIKDKQQALIHNILAIEPSAKIIQTLRLVANTITIEMSATMAKNVANMADVHSVSLLETSSNSSSTSSDSLAETFTNISKKSADSPYYNLKTGDAKGHVTVALIGSGVDYTHAQLGGDGTREHFIDAYNNISNAWDGFPNDVVIAGFDFASENAGYDYNPWEYPVSFDDAFNDSVHYEAGMGTMAASLVLQSAPEAKIMSFKVSGGSPQAQVFPERKDQLLAALEMAVDPNMDGDMSDAARILLIDSNPMSWSGFYQQQDSGLSNYSVEISALRMVAAAGTLVVIPAGDNGVAQSYYNVGHRSIFPESLSVGYSERVDNKYKVTDDSPIGPTRGLSVAKPDLLSLNTEPEGALIGSGMDYGKMEADFYFAAARVAAAAASVMETHPQLTSHEVKALLVNTGIVEVTNDYGVPQIGGGNVNPLAANNSKALIYQKYQYQPSVNFGQVGVYQSRGFSRDVVIKNLTDIPQEYQAKVIINGEKIANKAIKIRFPEDIILEPGVEKTVAITIEVDANKLPPVAIAKGNDFSLENWDQYALNGYIELVQPGMPGNTIHLPWLIMPKRSYAFDVDSSSSTLDSFFTDEYYLEQDDTEIPQLPHDQSWKTNAQHDVRLSHYQIELENTSNVNQPLYAMPLVHYRERKPLGKESYRGHIVKAIAGGVYPEQQCQSGEKISIAVTMFEKFDFPLANHVDKIGSQLFTINLYDKATIELYDFDPYALDKMKSEVGKVAFFSMMLNEDLKSQAQYVDLSMEFDQAKPASRYKDTDLPTVLTPGGNTVIVNNCTDTLYHGNINAETFNQIIGVQVATDRDAVPARDESIIVHNFKLNGRIFNDTVEQDETDDEQELCEAGYITDGKSNCIRVYATDTEQVLLYQHLELTVLPQMFCSPLGDYLSSCSVSHPQFQQDITFQSPTSSPGLHILCDFTANSPQVWCNASGLIEGNGHVKSEWNFEVNLLELLKPSSSNTETNISKSLLTGMAVKLANITGNETDDELANLKWQSHINVSPGARAKVSFIFDEKCGLQFSADATAKADERCMAKGLLFNPTTGLNVLINDSSVIGSIKSGQQFSINENAENGTVIGKIDWQYNLLQTDNDDYVRLIDGDFGAPFQLSPQGVLSVRDTVILDYEQKRFYELVVQVITGNTFGDQKTITVSLINENDNAPELINSISVIDLTVNETVEALYIGKYFTDIDGFNLRFDVAKLPTGLSMDKAGYIYGTPSKVETINTSLVVHDGENSIEVDLSFNITSAADAAGTVELNEGSSGGAASFFLIFIALMSYRKISFLKAVKQ